MSWERMHKSDPRKTSWTTSAQETGGSEGATMRAETIAYMIYLEGPEFPEYVMHFFYPRYSGTPKNGNMLGNSLPIGSAHESTENDLKYSGCPQ